MRRYENNSLIILLSPAIRKWCYLKVRKKVGEWYNFEISIVGKWKRTG